MGPTPAETEHPAAWVHFPQAHPSFVLCLHFEKEVALSHCTLRPFRAGSRGVALPQLLLVSPDPPGRRASSSQKPASFHLAIHS